MRRLAAERVVSSEEQRGVIKMVGDRAFSTVLPMKHLRQWPDVHEILVEQVAYLYREEPCNGEFATGRPLCLVISRNVQHETLVNIAASWSKRSVRTPASEKITTSRPFAANHKHRQC